MKAMVELKTGKVISVRDFVSNDFDRLVTFFEGLRGETMRFGIPGYYDRGRLQEWASDMSRNIILLGLNGERIVGVAAILGSRLPWLRGIGNFITYVHQDFQNQGLGTYLTKAILEEARHKDYHKVSLEVIAENVAGIKAYQKAGFVVEGNVKDYHFGDDGAYHNVLVMGIIL
jgi:RimJ/RimL family protein N-acetyltransferase